MNNKNIIITILISGIVATGAFYGGIKYEQQRRPVQRGQQLRTNFRPVNGEIIAVDDKSITVKTSDGGSKIILFSDKSIINKAIEVTKSELKVGENVMVIGQLNSDGSVTAENIRLNIK